jgi:Protein of unknown function (DUF3102)
VANVIEIGRRLTEAKALAGHGGWLPSLEREFGWTVKTSAKTIGEMRWLAGRATSR